MKYLLFLSLFFQFALSNGCGPIPDYRILVSTDIKPPVLLSVKTESADRMSFIFNEPPFPAEERIRISPELGILSAESLENSLIIIFGKDQTAGLQYIIEADVRDEKGNSLNFITSFYGYNPDIPDIVINEFITQGSTKHPDLIELYIKEGGNMAGVSLYEGTDGNWTHKFIFPGVEVPEGSFILVHFKPQGIPEEVDEIEDPVLSGGYDASDNALDFWVPGGKGLSGNNGVLSVYTSPGGLMIDGVLYSNRTSLSDENYRGFGTKKTMERADELYDAGKWIIQGEAIAPEDAVSPEDSTSTRSVCRSSGSADTDAPADWHIVPTRGSTFGTANIDDIHEN